MSGYNVDVNTKYAIVVHGNSFDADNFLVWDGDNYLADSDYAGGDYKLSQNGGDSWAFTYTDRDLLFRCYSA